MDIVKNWFKRHFHNQQIVILSLLVVAILFVIIVLAEPLMPVLASVVIAYLLQAPLQWLERHRIPHLVAVVIVFVFFLSAVAVVLFTVVPLFVDQVGTLLRQVPFMMAEVNNLLAELPDDTPIERQEVEQIYLTFRRWVGEHTQAALSFSLASIPQLASLSIYLVLIPVLLFFMLKDQKRIVAWFVGFLPSDRGLATEVWSEVDAQIGNYARGKLWEICIVAGVSYITFLMLGVDYALLLSLLTGISVLIPLIGAIAVTLPVAVLSYFQYGWDIRLLYVVLAYVIIQQLDGNLLQPILFSEAVKMHPVAIIVAVLVFGWIWGIWGIIFAIPLATVVNAILRAWPRHAGKSPTVVPGERPADRAARG